MKKPIHHRNLPASVKVGHRDLTIKLATLVELVDAYGDYHKDTQLIRLGDWLRPQDLVETLLHELLHACWPQRWSRVGDVEEDIVCATAPMLAQVWRDNPELVEWITHSLLGE